MTRSVRDERTARMALACVSEPGDSDLAQAVTRDGPEAVWQSLWEGRRETRWGRRLASVRLEQTVVTMQRRQLRYLIPGDAEWPEALDDLAEASNNGIQGRPLGLWAAGPGHLGDWSADSIAIVGTRTSTRYGEAIATDLAADLCAKGTTIVSGGAYGIDICAHRGALGAAGRTIAVLASGLDEPYPRGNLRVFEEIRERGLLLSELPPGQRPTRPRFLSRNRLIAALSQGSLMVEARLRSGAQNTLSWADQLSRIRMAVPGPVTSAQSEGPHHQLRHGAQLVTSAAEIRELVAPMGQETLPFPRGPRRIVDGLDEDLAEVFEAVPGRGGRSSEEIAGQCGRDLMTTIVALVELEERRLVDKAVDGTWKLRAGSVG